MLKRMLLSIILSVFMVGCLMTNVMATEPNPYPDTSYFEGSQFRATDLNDKLKYKTVGAIRMNQMIISYHISIGNIFPKYVSLLWYGEICVGITYYDSGVFHIWMKQSPDEPRFKKFPIVKHIQEAFKADFERIWKDVEFQLSTMS